MPIDPKAFRSRLSTLVTIAALSTASVAIPVGASAAAGISCRDVHIPVSLAPGGARNQSVYGELCVPAKSHPRVIQVLVHGTTYDHNYWDLPGFGGRYSYVKHTVARGYAALAIDRVGVGRSSHPLSALITVDADAETLHQVLQAVRSTGFPGGAYSRVALVSHSFGTEISELELSRYHDADGFIATGWLAGLPKPVSTAGLLARSYSAFLDPAFAGRGLDPGYLTTRPGTRAFLYQEGTYDPAVLAKDEELKQTYTSGELATFTRPLLLEHITEQITGPVLLVLGEYDVFFCGLLAVDCSTGGSVRRTEAPYWKSASSLQAYVQQGAGHDISLSYNNTAGFVAEDGWLAAEFPLG
jgi:pimeloyl-ACP methyl ester carboxylesterase